MAEEKLIRANEIEELFYKQVALGATDIVAAFEDALTDTQTVEAVPVVHGRWVKQAETNIWRDKVTVFGCTNCKKFHAKGKGITVRYDYCPNCGAKMDIN